MGGIDHVSVERSIVVRLFCLVLKTNFSHFFLLFIILILFSSESFLIFSYSLQFRLFFFFLRVWFHPSREVRRFRILWTQPMPP